MTNKKITTIYLDEDVKRYFKENDINLSNCINTVLSNILFGSDDKYTKMKEYIEKITELEKEVNNDIKKIINS